jgi:hypothetical protein
MIGKDISADAVPPSLKFSCDAATLPNISAVIGYRIALHPACIIWPNQTQDKVQRQSTMTTYEMSRDGNAHGG